jgi:hypothetical protein
VITGGYWHELGDGLVTDACLERKELGLSLSGRSAKVRTNVRKI